MTADAISSIFERKLCHTPMCTYIGVWVQKSGRTTLKCDGAERLQPHLVGVSTRCGTVFTDILGNSLTIYERIESASLTVS